MPYFLYVLAAYNPHEDRAYPVYACSDIRFEPDDDGDRDALLRLMAQGHGFPDDSDYAEVVRAAYARLCAEGGELDRHLIAAPLPLIPPDHVRIALWALHEARPVPGELASLRCIEHIELSGLEGKESATHDRRRPARGGVSAVLALLRALVRLPHRGASESSAPRRRARVLRATDRSQ